MNKEQQKELFSVILLATIVAIFSVSFLGTMTFNIQALKFSINVEIFNHGYTQINIPPVGSVQAQTHSAPIKLNITLQNIDLDLLEDFLTTGSEKEEFINVFQTRLVSFMKIFVFRLFILSLIGGMVGGLLYKRDNFKHILYGGLVGLILFITLLWGTYTTYDIQKFQHPEYQGVLEAAPWMIGLAEQALVNLDTLGDQLELMAVNLYDLFEKINTLESLSEFEGTLKVLHVSDYHNNRAALQFVNQVIRSFQVDMVIDTGDFTDYATPIELQLLEYLNDIQVPYIYIPGNHDAPSIINRLQDIPQVTVIKEGIATIKGLKILGIQDPAALTNQAVPPNREIITKYQNKLLELWEENITNPPDMVLVHNYQIGQILANKAPLILHGHDHDYKVYHDGDTLVVDAGTTGAAGIRGLQVAREIPYTVLLLHFQKDMGGSYKVTAIDTIKVFNLRAGFILERTIIGANN